MWGGWQQVSAAQSLSRMRERGGGEKTERRNREPWTPEQKCIDLSDACRFIASFSSRKSRSSYPDKPEKPVSGPRPCCKVRCQRPCRPPPWMSLLLYSCPSQARLFWERGRF